MMVDNEDLALDVLGMLRKHSSDPSNPARLPKCTFHVHIKNTSVVTWVILREDEETRRLSFSHTEVGSDILKCCLCGIATDTPSRLHLGGSTISLDLHLCYQSAWLVGDLASNQGGKF